jgi:hypothetical protein
MDRCNFYKTVQPSRKGRQIKLMPKIYSHAANVLAWLGEDANNSELLVP